MPFLHISVGFDNMVQEDIPVDDRLDLTPLSELFQEYMSWPPFVIIPPTILLPVVIAANRMRIFIPGGATT